MSFIYAISDIHGRVDLLRALIDENIDFSNINTKLVLCGDYIDGAIGTNSYECLCYIYDLSKQYPNQVIVLRGNHEEWFVNWLKDGALLRINQLPQITLIQDFMTEDEFRRIYIHAKRNTSNNIELSKYIYNACKKNILKNHVDLIYWLKNLPYYYESEYNQIFVHAGIFEFDEEPELWKIYSSNDEYLMKYPPEKSYFYKDIIAGHISTAQIVSDPSFHHICCYGTHYYLDSTVIVSNQLNLLKYDISKQQYSGIWKENDNWIEYKVNNFNTERK